MAPAAAQHPHFDLARFRAAQAAVIEQVREELRAGCKRSHWMWFIFPQLRGLGQSPTAQYYAIDSPAAADAYLQDPLLGTRLLECTQLVNAVAGRSAREIFGYPDDLKFRSCMTLFAQRPGAAPAFRAALERYFAGEPDPLTLRLLQRPPGG